jgi:hypothetical protein
MAHNIENIRKAFANVNRESRGSDETTPRLPKPSMRQ